MARRFRVLVLASVAAGLLAVIGAAAGGTGPAAAAVVPAAGLWGRAIAVPGLARLNQGPYALVASLSCPSAGNCAASGFYHDRPFHQQGYVVTERDGRWGRAIEVPGLAALNQGGFAGAGLVSCGSAGNCAAGGEYTDRLHHGQGFVVSEQDGRWGRAIEVPGLAALNQGGDARVWALACGSAGNCAAGGSYTDRHGDQLAFVAVERAGHWGQAIGVPGLAALAPDGPARVESLACVSATYCAAVGYANGQGFTDSEQNGRWAQAALVPGLKALNTFGAARIYSVSCASSGNCVAGGSYAYRGSPGFDDAFVTVAQDGRWGRATKVFPRAPTKGLYYAAVNEVSCVPAGPCTVAGGYQGHANEGFVVTERNGRWGVVTKVLVGLPINGDGLYALSCPAPGDCAAGGSALNNEGISHAIVISEQNGRWSKPTELLDLQALTGTNSDSDVFAISCGAPANCIAGGDSAQRGFLTTSPHQ